MATMMKSDLERKIFTASSDRRHALLGSLAARLTARLFQSDVGNDKIANLRANLGRVAVPFVLPVAVDFPTGANQGVSVIAAPLENRVVGLVEPAVGAEMRGEGDQASRRRGADDFAVPGKRSLQLDADFEVDLAIEIDRDMPAGPCDFLGPDDAPHKAAGLRHDLGKLSLACEPAHHCQWTTGTVFDLNVVWHVLLVRRRGFGWPV